MANKVIWKMLFIIDIQFVMNCERCQRQRNKKMTIFFRLISVFILGLALGEVYNIWIFKNIDQALADDEIAGGEEYFLLVILILSSPDHFEKRKTIRETWLTLKPRVIDGTDFQDVIFIPRVNNEFILYNEGVLEQEKNANDYEKLLHTIKIPNVEDPKIKIKHFFVIGNLGLTKSSKMVTIVDEQAKYNDLLLLEDHEEKYIDLTEKLVKAMKKLEIMNINYKYLFKCDDDTYSKLDVMSEALNQYDMKLEKMKKEGQTMTNLQLYWGYFDGRSPVQRSGKYEEKEYNLCSLYIPYAVGGGYVLSKGLVTYIAKQSDFLSQYRSEDASVGTWLSSMRNIHQRHDVRFDSWYTPRDCKQSHFVLHKRTIKDMEKIFNGNPCHAEQRKSKLYEYYYNWKSFPSRCCCYISWLKG